MDLLLKKTTAEAPSVISATELLSAVKKDIEGIDTQLEVLFGAVTENTKGVRESEFKYVDKKITENLMKSWTKNMPKYEENLASFVQLLQGLQKKFREVERTLENLEHVMIDMERKIAGDVVTRKAIEGAIRKDGVLELASAFSGLGHPSIESSINSNGIIYYDPVGNRLRICIGGKWKTIMTNGE